eukprot:7527846-Pyramimonas_sp.AAC.1
MRPPLVGRGLDESGAVTVRLIFGPRAWGHLNIFGARPRAGLHLVAACVRAGRPHLEAPAQRHSGGVELRPLRLAVRQR